MGRRRKLKWDTVAILGVGLIGGSIGLALCERGLARRVVGIGRSAARLGMAKRMGAITSTTVHLKRGVADAELTVVCTPVARIVEDVRAVAEHCPAGSLITDVGSTKREIVAALDMVLSRDVGFVGSHPLAGSEKTGVAAARADLFQGRVTVVTPTRRSDEKDVAAVSKFWSDIGSRVDRMSATVHDRIVAATSHLPHLVASVLSSIARGEELSLASTGWFDTTRIAAGDPELWTQILLMNRRHVSKALDRFETRLAAVRRGLNDGDAASLTRFLEQAKQNRDAVGN